MKLFFSYTTRDKFVTLKFLLELKETLNKIEDIESFIDIIDNNSNNKQEEVLKQLKHSDYVILITSPSTFKSKWVNLEIEYASINKIEIKKISLEEIKKTIFKIKKINNSYLKKQCLYSILK